MSQIYEDGVPQKERRGMVLIEGGGFNMGSNEGESDEMPVHNVFVNSFWLDKFPVTMGQFYLYCGSVGKEFPQLPDWEYNENNPMVNVSWEEALEYAKWVGKRLPTEAEWEYAARGGIKSSSFNFCGGNDPNEIAWYCRNTENPMPIGLKKPNELDIYDMCGNVWEWCNDWYNEMFYFERIENNPKGPSSGSLKVLRGGSFFNDSYFLRLSNRHRLAPHKRNSMIGFRCAKNM